MTQLKLVFLFSTLLAPGWLSAQSLSEVNGIVTDSLAQTGLPGVTVVVKGTQRGTTTNADGGFTIQAASNEVLTFSFVGYGLKEVPVGNKTTFNVSLSPSTNALDELVVVGYGTMKKSDLTGAVIRIDAKTFKNQPMTQLSDMLTGTVAGFNANQNPTAAGGSSLQVRGPKSLNASTNPMVVMDGVIFNGSIADINPADIETIDILKDASSAAVFGARAAGGVILVTTKKGTTGKPVINFSANVGVTETTKDFKPFDKDGYLTFRRDILRATNPNNPGFYYDNPTQLPVGVTVEQWRKASNNPQADNNQEWLGRLRFFPIETENYLAGKTVDWYDEVIRTGVRQNYDVSIGGGAKNVTYYWSLGYQNNEGVLRGDKFSTIRSRLNVDFKVTDWLNVGVNAQFADRDESAVTANLGQMYLMSPYGSLFDANGDPSWYPNSFAVANPLIDYYGQDRLRKINTLFASMYAKLKLPFGFDYKLSFQPRYETIKDYDFWSSKTLQGGSTRSNGYGTRDDASTYEWILDNLLHWNKQFGVHSFDVTMLYSSERKRDWASTITNQSFVPNQNLGFHGLQYGISPTVSTNDTQITGDAAMVRLNYSLLDRYLFTGSLRRDGYSAFGTKQPRATFPAAALAWKISEEDFFNLNFVSQMKLRLSYGVNGNRDIGAYSALAQLLSTQYYDGSAPQVGVYPSTLANSNLVWERTESINVGMDVSFLKNRLDVSMEYYDMTTSNLLMNRLLPEITGFKNITSNLGLLGNKGFELTINTINTEQKNFSWRSSLAFSFNRNKIKQLFGDYKEEIIDGKTVKTELPDYTNEWFPGQALDRVWNYDVTGIWQVAEKDAAAVYKIQPGDFKATDVDANGKYEALLDKMFIGYRQPRFRIGLRNEFSFFKNFSASVFLRSELGHMAPFAEGLRTGGSDTYDRRNTNDFPYWTPDNPINDFPRLNTNTNVFGGGIKFYKPLSFVRVQDVNISYALPAPLASLLKLNNMRVFASARNLLTFTKWPGWDMRKVFDDKEIHAVSFATPNHWHALGTIWACQAGKHVYAEKPASHNVFEGRKMIEAARKYDRRVQVGFQNRSLPHVIEAVKFLHEGGIGQVYSARGVCIKPRDSFGIAKDSTPPSTLHYDQWLGPAPYRRYNEKRGHYNWHWFWDTGNGDTGNQGPHQFDIARWGLNKNEHPVSVFSAGGIYGIDSEECAQQTPNTQTSLFKYDDGKMLEFETRGRYSNAEASLGIRVGNMFYGTEGYLELDGSTWKAFRKRETTPFASSKAEPKKVDDPTFKLAAGGGEHYANFLSAIRDEKDDSLNCDINEGFYSTTLPLIANISYRLGRELKFMGDYEKFANDSEADAMLTAAYRRPFVVPDQV